MRTLIAAAAVFIGVPAFAQEDCTIADGMNVCPVPEVICDSAANYESPAHFAEAHGGKLAAFQQIGPTQYILIVALEGGSLGFVYDGLRGTVCLTHEATPIEKPAGMLL